MRLRKGVHARLCKSTTRLNQSEMSCEAKASNLLHLDITSLSFFSHSLFKLVCFNLKRINVPKLQKVLQNCTFQLSFFNLDESMRSDEVDWVVGVEELRVGQPLLAVVDESAQLFVQKSGDSLGSLVISVLHSVTVGDNYWWVSRQTWCKLSVGKMDFTWRTKLILWDPC